MPDIREHFSIRDERWLSAMLCVLFFLVGMAVGRIVETDYALSVARQQMAEWKDEARKEIREEEMRKASIFWQKRLQDQWPCERHEIGESGLICTLRVLKR